MILHRYGTQRGGGEVPDNLSILQHTYSRRGREPATQTLLK